MWIEVSRAIVSRGLSGEVDQARLHVSKHTQKCVERMFKQKALTEIYEAQWPDYCRVCYGTGMYYDTYDPSPAGVGLSSGFMVDQGPCSCVEDGFCPRCRQAHAEDFWNDEEAACTRCGFVQGDSGLPEPHECYCWDLSDEPAFWLESEDDIESND